MKLKAYPQGRGRDIYRVFDLPDNLSLDDLCTAVLESFNFDTWDHLYEFIIGGTHFLCSRAQEGGWFDEEETTADFALDDFRLFKGAKFFLHYDFGADWYFVISVMDTAASVRTWPEVIKSKGELEQYPSDEEDGDEYSEDGDM